MSRPKTYTCDDCKDTGIVEKNINGADVEGYCDCEKGENIRQEDNLYHFGVKDLRDYFIGKPIKPIS